MKSILAALAAIVASCLLVGAPPALAQTKPINTYPASGALTGGENLLGYKGSTVELVSTAQILAYVNTAWTPPAGSIPASALASGAALTNLGYTPAHAGANSDITALNGLTTPITLAQVGFTPLIASNNLSDLANLPMARANLGAPKIRTLESFAAALGITLGSANDQPVVDASNAAIIAAASTGGLVVEMPIGVTVNATHFLLDNNGGYACLIPGACRIHDIYAGPYTTPTYLVELNNPYATDPVLSGLYIDGGWTYGAGAYASNPESDPALDKRGGVNLVSAFNGISDTTYAANSFISSQEPRKYIQDLVIARFPGDCFTETGAGSNDTHNVRTQRCGGYGANLNTYDSNFYGLDLGEEGRSGLYCHDNCAANRFVAVKVWYAGFRNLSQQSAAALDCEGCSSNQFIGFEAQDPAGDCIRIDNGDLNKIDGTCQWQGQINALQPVICAVRLLGAIDSQIKIIASQIDHAGQNYYTVNKLVCDQRSARDQANTNYAYHNHVEFTTENWPQDFNGFSSTWITGPFDTSNDLTINGIPRQSSQIAGDPATGQVNIGANVCNTLAGVIAFGQASAYPGAVSIIGACGQGVALQTETSTGAYASAQLTSTANYADGEMITVGSQTYTLRDTVTAPVNFTGSISGSVLTVTQVYGGGALRQGDQITGVTAPNTVLGSLISGSASGAATWNISVAQTVSGGLMTSGINQIHIGATEAATIANITYAINAANVATANGSVSGNVVTIAQVYNGALHVGDTITCPDAVNCGGWIPTTITAQTSATGAIPSGNQGTYTLANTEPTVAYSNEFNIASGVIGTDYGYGTTPSFQVGAANNGAHVVTVTSLALGTAANSIPVSTTAAHASWSGSTLAGGAADNQTYVTQVGALPTGPVLNSFTTYTGVQPTYTGSCTTGSQKGVKAIGSFKAVNACSVGAGTGSITLTWASEYNPDGFHCDIHNLTTPADLWAQTAFTASSAAFSGAANAGDQLTYVCWRIP